MKHTRATHAPGEPCREDDGNICWICNIFVCSVCGGAEASLPSECPGRKMTRYEEDAVLKGTLDFFEGGWRTINYINERKQP